jgi:hypothetical protein
MYPLAGPLRYVSNETQLKASSDVCRDMLEGRPDWCDPSEWIQGLALCNKRIWRSEMQVNL